MKNEFSKRKQIRLPSQAYTENNAFSITIATAKRHPWFELHSSLAETLVSLIKQSAEKQKTNIFAWCVMPDHVHMLFQSRASISFVRLIKGGLTPTARQNDPGRALWQRSFYDHALRKEKSLFETARYIWNNPVRAGIVEKPADYPHSGSLVWPEWRSFML
jgi:REP element-mobilizing transposase RayT